MKQKKKAENQEDITVQEQKGILEVGNRSACGLGIQLLAAHVAKNHPFHAGRMAVFRDILERIGEGDREGLVSCIYAYGSMIKRQDLLARQVFLWLLSLAAEEEVSEKEAATVSEGEETGEK